MFRTHLILSFMVFGAVGFGSMLGTQAAHGAALEHLTVNQPTTTDPRHPVEVSFVPLFVRDLEVALDYLNLEVAEEDRVTVTPELALGMGGQLVIERAQPVRINDGGVERNVRTWAKTIGELLEEQGIRLGSQDRVEPNPVLPLTLEPTISITRVSVAEVVEHESIPYKTDTHDDPNRPRGDRRVIQTGQRGRKALTYQVTRENGQEVDRQLLRTEVVDEPVTEVVVVGTRTITLGEGTATWYDPPWSGLTAAHNTLPKGTVVDVVNVQTGQRVTVRINDHGIQGRTIIDLSVEAFRQLAPLWRGVILVRLEVAG